MVEPKQPCNSGSSGVFHSSDEVPIVSIVVPTYNEERYIQNCLRGIIQQTYFKERLEVLVADGMSADGTREIVSQAAQGHHFIKLLDNPKKITSEAVNIGVQASSGQIIIIVGGHCVISPEYVAKAVFYLTRSNHDIGVVGPTLEHVGEGLFGNLVAHALSSPFGVGNSRFRFSQKAQFVDTIAYGAYRRVVFDKVGLWSTDLVRNQDIEFNHRVRKYGWRLLLAPDMGCRYYTRTTMIDFILQNYGNGYWNILTFAQHPGSLSCRHFVPLGFVLGLLMASIAALLLPWGWLLLTGIIVLYSTGAVFVSATQSVIERQIRLLLLAFVFPLLHISYGLGSLAGVGKWIWSVIQRVFTPSQDKG